MTNVDVSLNVIMSGNSLRQQLEEILMFAGNNLTIEIQHSTTMPGGGRYTN